MNVKLVVSVVAVVFALPAMLIVALIAPGGREMLGEFFTASFTALVFAGTFLLYRFMYQEGQERWSTLSEEEKAKETLAHSQRGVDSTDYITDPMYSHMPGNYRN